MKSYNVAIIGASGVVGTKFLELLTEYNFPVNNLYPFASSRSAGREVSCLGNVYKIIELTKTVFDEYEIDIALFSAGGEISEKYAPIAAANGVLVIDNSSFWRMDPNIKLVVPEVNGFVLTGEEKIIANPNCSTIQSVVALQAIEQLFTIKAIDYTTYQAVSGSGASGITDLERGLRGEQQLNYPYPIANNVLPQIDQFLESGFTKEEQKMIDETKKIMQRDDLAISATCVRVPVMNGHSVSMIVECEEKVDLAALRELYANFPGVVLCDDISNQIYPMPLVANNTDDTFVGRLRIDPNNERKVHVFCSSDNIRKGAAANTIQIAQYMLVHNLI